MVDRRDALPLLGWVPVAAVLGWWTFTQGGYPARIWYPGALVLLAVLALSLTAARPRPPARPAVLALGALTAYTAWSYLSILWSGDAGLALEGSHRTLAYLLAFAALAVLPWTPRAVLVALGSWIALVAVAGLVTLLRLHGAHALDQVIDARLARPLGYQNADAALWMMAALPAWALGARRETATVLRPVLLAAGALLVELVVLTQSRGWLFTLPLVLVAALLLVPGRVRLLTFALPVLAGPLIALHALLEPYRSAGGKQPGAAAGPVTHALHHAVGPALLGVGVALVVGAALVAIDRRLRIGTGAVRRINRAAVVVAVLLALGGVAGGLAATHGDPGGRISHAWRDFKDFKRADRPGQSHLTSLGSSRYDFWRVSLDVVGDHPLAGLGQDNFANAYLVRRQSLEEPRWTHSLELRLLVHTGSVGLLLFMAFLAALVWAALRAVRGSQAARLATGVALLPIADWVLHGSVDWLWEYPALSVAALAFAAMAVAVGEPAGRPRWAPGRTGRRVLTAVGGLGAVAAAVALACGWIAAWGLDRAATQWANNPSLAMRRLDRAAELDPLDHQVPLVRGLIEELRGEHLRAISSLREAADDVPGDWFPRFELGLIRANSSARADLLAARARNPREALIGVALRRLGTPHPLTIAQAATIFRNRVDRRLARPSHRRATN